jgi:CheY-like chemotaxis protein
MSHKILVVDRNQAFATMLEQMLEMEGGYEVQAAHTGSDALLLLEQADFDLTIVDMDLDAEDMGYQELILSLRRLEPTMRLMLIPLVGSDLPPEALELDIQGALSKPFFAGNLLPDIQTALAKQVSARPAAPVATPSPAQPGEPPPDRIQATLSELAREIDADAILLLSTATTDVRIVAHAGTLPGPKIQTLAELGIASVRSAQATAQFLGGPDRPFEHNIFESDSLRLYIMFLANDELLLAVTPTSTRLGTIRHSLRRAARDLRRYR